MVHTAKTNPTTFFCCLRQAHPERCAGDGRAELARNLSMEDWQVMREAIETVRQALPDAASAKPGAVLEHVLGALRAADDIPAV